MRQLRHSARAACRPQGPNGPGRRLAQYRACASADRPGKLRTVGMTPTFLRRRCHVPPPQPGSTTGHLASGGSGRVACSVDPRRAAMAIPCLALAAAAGLMLAGAPAQAAQRNMEGNHLPFAPQSAFTGPGGQIELRAACPPATHPGETACFAVARQDTRSGAPQHAGSRDNQAAAPFTVAGYGPSSLRSAYHLPSGRGHGRVVAIVDAYDDPKAESNLAHYRRNFGLPACTAKNGCFRKVNQRGGRSYPRANAGWAAEISLDLDMVSATCPK